MNGHQRQILVKESWPSMYSYKRREKLKDYIDRYNEPHNFLACMIRELLCKLHFQKLTEYYNTILAYYRCEKVQLLIIQFVPQKMCLHKNCYNNKKQLIIIWYRQWHQWYFLNYKTKCLMHNWGFQAIFLSNRKHARNTVRSVMKL